MIQFQYDIVVLTEKQYMAPEKTDVYIENVLLEDQLVLDALVAKGYRAIKLNWDHLTFDWSSTRAVLFRTIWDYHHRWEEFDLWLKKVSGLTRMINSIEIVRWNIDKHYLQDLQAAGTPIVPTLFVHKGQDYDLADAHAHFDTDMLIIKPTISASARDTHKLHRNDLQANNILLAELLQYEDMMVQPFIDSIESKGEVSYMVMNGTYTHAILKRAKTGDFRVQDDFGGTVHDYEATPAEIAFAEQAVRNCPHPPLYARVDVVWDNHNLMRVGELELIEPELWFRNCKEAAVVLAEGVEV